MGAWLLMMLLCQHAGSCEEVAIDAYDSQDQCEAARQRADIRQRTIQSPASVAFACRKDGQRLA